MKTTRAFQKYWSYVELPVTLEPYEYNMLKRYAYNAWKAGRRYQKRINEQGYKRANHDNQR